jgi:hypothetical protein
MKFVVKLFYDIIDEGHCNYRTRSLYFEEAQKLLQEKISTFPTYRYIIEPYE